MRLPIAVASVIMIALVVLGLGAVGTTGADDTPKVQRELHVVCVYEGNTKTGNEIHGGRAIVAVDRPGKLVTLVLAGNDSVLWNLSVGEGTKLQKVILGGYYRQAVKGVPEGVEVAEAYHEGLRPNGKYIPAAYNTYSPSFRAMVRVAKELTGQEIGSFQGAYQFRPEAPFLVDKLQFDPRLASDFPKVTPAADLPRLEFKALHFVADKHWAAKTAASYGDFTLAGAKADSLRALPQGIRRLAYDPVAKKYYGLLAQDVCEVDFDKQTFTKLDLGFDVPRLSWPFDITFDTKRQRLLIGTRTGQYLYAFSPGTKKWSILAQNLGVEALTYHPKHDCLYGVRARQHEEDLPELLRFNADGAALGRYPLNEPMFPLCLAGGAGDGSLQIVPADEYVVIMGSQGRDGSDDQPPPESYMFLVDWKSNKVSLTWKGK